MTTFNRLTTHYFYIAAFYFQFLIPRAYPNLKGHLSPKSSLTQVSLNEQYCFQGDLVKHATILPRRTQTLRYNCMSFCWWQTLTFPLLLLNESIHYPNDLQSELLTLLSLILESHLFIAMRPVIHSTASCKLTLLELSSLQDRALVLRPSLL